MVVMADDGHDPSWSHETELKQPVTELLHRAFSGDEQASNQLLSLVYPRLHAIAARQRKVQAVTMTQAATDILHEAYERLAQQRVQWRNRSHFYALAARLARRVIVDHQRRRLADKRGGAQEHATLSSVAAPDLPTLTVDWLDLERALQTLEQIDPDSLQLIEMRIFVGMSITEVAAARDCALATVKRHWQYAKAQLIALLDEGR